MDTYQIQSSMALHSQKHERAEIIWKGSQERSGRNLVWPRKRKTAALGEKKTLSTTASVGIPTKR